MNRQSVLSLLASAILVMAGCATNPSEQLADFSKDAIILRDAIDALYPSKDRYGQGQAVDSAVSQMIEVAHATNDAMTFYKSVTAVAVATRDEHVKPFPPDAYRTYRHEDSMMLPY